MVGRAREEVEAAAEGEKVGALRYQRRTRREEEDVVVAAAGGSRIRRVDGLVAVERLELRDRVAPFLSVYENNLYAVDVATSDDARSQFPVPRSQFPVPQPKHACRARKPRVVYVGDDKAPRTLLRRVAGDVDAA